MTLILVTPEEFAEMPDEQQRAYLLRWLGKAEKDNNEFLGNRESRLKCYNELYPRLFPLFGRGE